MLTQPFMLSFWILVCVGLVGLPHSAPAALATGTARRCIGGIPHRHRGERPADVRHAPGGVPKAAAICPAWTARTRSCPPS